MREIDVDEIRNAVEEAFIEANTELPSDVYDAIKKALSTEVSPYGREVLNELIENAEYAKEMHIPICQDTGVAVIFLEIGQDVHITGGVLSEAIDEGVRRAYRNGYLRKSLCHPFSRENTGDNTPAICHTEIVAGEQIRLIVIPKGGGSENCSEARMLLPYDGKAGIKRFVLELIRRAGPNPCPPITVGIGIGGNLEQSALLAKKALIEPLGSRNKDGEMAELEMEILAEINKTGIGPQGYGGKVTCLDVHIKGMPCHIASLPVAVNVQCHAHRIKERVI